jgi:hypothetical protein
MKDARFAVAGGGGRASEIVGALGRLLRNRWLNAGVALALVAFGVAAYFFRLRSVPPGYYHDTGAVILNADCIARTGGDEYGVRHPFLGLRSFGEGKAAGFTYLISFFAHFTTVTPLLTRVVSASAGFVAIALMFGFAYKTRAVPRARHLWLTAALFCLCLTSSWILVLHRFPTECTLVDILVMASIAAAYPMLKEGNLAYAAINGFFVGLGAYAYHSLKVMLVLHPAIILATVWYARRAGGRATFKSALTSIGVAAAVGSPLLYDMISMGESMRRFTGQKGFEDSWMTRLTRYFSHIDINFLFLSGDSNLVEHNGFLGQLSLGLLPGLVWGVVLAFRAVKRGNGFWSYVVLLAVLSFAPAALAPGAPHSLHSNAATIPMMLIALLGTMTFDRLASYRGPVFSRPFVAVAALFVAVSSVAFVNNLVWYFGAGYAEASKPSWQPYLDVEKAVRDGNRGIGVNDHSTGSVFLRAGDVGNGDPRYCGVGK